MRGVGGSTLPSGLSERKTHAGKAVQRGIAAASVLSDTDGPMRRGGRMPVWVAQDAR